MSCNFNANQFEAEFNAKRLNNWGVPKWYPDRPKQPRKVPTRIIVNDQGHLLPGIHRVPGDSAWGNYIGTWDLPKKISRKLANEINKSRRPCLSAWDRRSSHVPLTIPGLSASKREQNGKKQDDSIMLKNGEKQRSLPPSVNGTKQDILASKNNVETGKITIDTNNKPKSRSVSTAGSERTSRHGNHQKKNNKSISHTKSPTLVPPLAGSYSNFQIAKKLHRENLEHKPLPDTVQDSLYKCLQTNKLPHPGKSLRVGTPRAAAVGYRGYGASGPSQCSKLRVYRPKTAQETEKTQEEEILPRRPSTAAHLSDMQLAICWDLKPEREEDQPRPPRHIDGSNGSAAPAVFALVHQPQPEILNDDNAHNSDKNNGAAEGCNNNPPGKERNILSAKCTGNGCNTPPTSNGFITPPKKSNCDTKDNCTGENGCNTPPFKNTRPKTGIRDAKENRNPNIDRRYQSSPNLVFDQTAERRQMGSRPCMACELKNLPSQLPAPSPYKMAFKAGKPNNSFDSGSSRPVTAKQVRVPKPRAPFAKRSYSIDTLAPPFSLWPGNTGQDYPEHWRLASVYQHAYKPIETRRKPLLASVYQ